MWVWLGLLCALLTGSSDAIAKKLLVRSNERVVAWAILLCTIPWLFLAPLVQGFPRLGLSFWLTVAVMIPLELSAHLAYLRAIRISPLSLSVPFLAFSPLLSALSAWVFLGESISMLGLAGVASVTVGAYVLQAELVPRGLLEPFKAMARVPGIRLMIFTAVIYGLTSTLGKKAIQLSSPASFLFIYFSLDAILLTEIARRSAGSSGALIREFKPQLWVYLLSGVVTAGAFYTHCYGIQQAPVAYFIAIKRLSLLVSVLYGGFLFREMAFGWRLTGAALMLAGAILVGLG